jgi:hypothetical protein
MTIENHTPFPALAFRQFNLAGEINGVVVARGSYEIIPGARMRPLEKQSPLIMSDLYCGSPQETPMLAQNDLVPFKPGTDVTLRGWTFSPGGEPRANWRCGVKLGMVEKIINVHGPRVWEPVIKDDKLLDWTLGPATPVDRVELGWQLATGGILPGSSAEKTRCADNPVGCGLVDLVHCDHGQVHAAPQTERPEAPLRHWKDKVPPVGLGPVSPWWRQRARYCGTYDAHWLEERHPLLPLDFDYHFYQCAPEDQIAEPWLSGGETLELVHFSPLHTHIVSQLPHVDLEVRLQRDQHTCRAAMVLDGVHIEVTPHGAEASLTWRTGFPWPDGRGTPVLLSPTSDS